MPGPLEDALFAYTGETAAEFVVPAFLSAPAAAGPGGQIRFRPVTLRIAVGPGARPSAVPLVSCLMVTKDRFELAQLAVGCFRRQSWPRKELVILDEGADGRLRDWVAGLTDPDIRLVPVAGGRTLGELRNQSLELARGDFVCQWDDDDLQHPARLEIALAAMAATQTTTSFLARETMWVPARQRMATVAERPRPHENTVLAPRGSSLRYPSLARAEDTPAVLALVARQRAVLLDLPQLYVYGVHGRNTWDDDHMERMWLSTFDRTEGPETDHRLKRFAKVYPVADYARIAIAADPGPARLGPSPSVAAPVTIPASQNPSLLDYAGREDADLTFQGYWANTQQPRGFQLRPVTMNLRIGPSRRTGILPLVSCLMVTADRFELARISIGCFQRQSWPNRELVVLDGSGDDRLRDWIAGLRDRAIRWISTRGSTAPLGDRRNRSIAEARGEVICVWDDDDLHHPARIEICLAAMSAARVPACFLAHETLWMVRDRRLGVLQGNARPQENTLTAVKSAGLRYASVPRFEDTPAVRDLLSRHQAILINAPQLYVYVIHGGNTWNHEHHANLWNVAVDRVEGPAAGQRLHALSRMYPLAEYMDALRRATTGAAEQAASAG